jgi:hypothetical protein
VPVTVQFQWTCPQNTLKLLNCTHIGNKSVLFFAGAYKCSAAWQWPFYSILAMLPITTVLFVDMGTFKGGPTERSFAGFAKSFCRAIYQRVLALGSCACTSEVPGGDDSSTPKNSG